MSTEQNRKVADELFARLSAGDIPGALATMTDDATYVEYCPALSPELARN